MLRNRTFQSSSAKGSTGQPLQQREATHLDDLAELPKVFGGLQHILVAEVHGQPHHIHQVALHNAHVLRTNHTERDAWSSASAFVR